MIPTIPDHAPFSPEQRSWLNGFFAGLFSTRDVEGPPSGAASITPAVPVVVLYGSQTGTAEGLAKKTVKTLKADGFDASATELDAVSLDELTTMDRMLVMTSTYGDGEMPDNAQAFWDDLMGDDAPRLDSTVFSVCALGDSSYPDFCQAGKDLDARLEALGAERIHQRVDCDVDFEEPFSKWLDGVRNALGAFGGDGAMVTASLNGRP